MQRIILTFLLSVSCLSQMAQAGQPRTFKTSFSNTVERYHSPLGFFAEIETLIPVRDEKALPEKCREVTETNVAVLGSNDPSAAKALETQPGVLYFNLYQECVHAAVTNSFSQANLSYENAKQILGSSLAKKLGNTPWNRIQIAQLNPDLQRQLMAGFISYIAGPEIVLFAKKYIGPNNVFGEDEIKNPDQLVTFLGNHILKLNPQSTLADVYETLILILRNGPVIKT